MLGVAEDRIGRIGMDGKTLHRVVRERAEELPGAHPTHPFGPDWEVWKVRGKVFLLLTVLDDAPIANVKARPADGAQLREAYPEIAPGYHMNKRHWLSLHPGGTLDAQLVEDLVTESYLLVVEHSVPQRDWPVAPHAFGRPTEDPDETDDAPRQR